MMGCVAKSFRKRYPKHALWLEEVEEVLPPECVWDVGVGEETEHCLLFGLGQGEAFEKLLGWLERSVSRRVFVIEPYLEVAVQMERSACQSPWACHPQIEVHPCEDEAIQYFRWACAQSKIEIFKDPRYCEQMFAAFSTQVAREHGKMQDFLEEIETFGALFYRNFYQNIRKIPSSYALDPLEGIYQGRSCCVLGAGPSLDQDGEHVQEFAKQGMVVTGSSGILAAQSLEIVPELYAMVDPNEAQTSRSEKILDASIPMLFSSRACPQALEVIDNPLIYVPGSSLYSTPSWLDQELGIVACAIDEGFNVVNFLTDLVRFMGVDQIYFAGLDLSYQQQRVYLEGVDTSHPLHRDAQEWIDAEGNHFLTRQVWLQERDWIDTFAHTHPDISCYNLTSQGLGFAHVPRVSRHVSEGNEASHAQTPHPLPLVSYHTRGVTEAKVVAAIKTLQDSLKVCRDHLVSLLKRHEEVESPQDDVEIYCLEQQLCEQVAFEAVLDLFSHTKSKLLSHDPEFAHARVHGFCAQQSRRLSKKHHEHLLFLLQVIDTQLLVQEEFFWPHVSSSSREDEEMLR